MNGEVVPLFGRCRSCKQPLGSGPEHVDQVVGTLCRTCFERSAAFMVTEKELFELLLAAGVTRPIANVMMIAKHEAERENGTLR